VPTKKKPELKVETVSQELPLRIVLVAPPSGVDFGIQHGKGSAYTTIQTQRTNGGNLTFEFTIKVKGNAGEEQPNFLSPLAQGPMRERFVYIDIGKLAGQDDSCWQRRIKVPLAAITWELIQQTLANKKLILEAQLQGTGKDGGPSCATVHPIGGWKCCKR
jgi:Family of unknown function (DUF5990)